MGTYRYFLHCASIESHDSKLYSHLYSECHLADFVGVRMFVVCVQIGMIARRWFFDLNIVSIFATNQDQHINNGGEGGGER